MLGYAIAILFGLVLVFLLMSRLAKAGPSRGREGKPIGHDAPSADAPTPAQSTTASPTEVRSAERRTPPA